MDGPRMACVVLRSDASYLCIGCDLKIEGGGYILPCAHAVCESCPSSCKECSLLFDGARPLRFLVKAVESGYGVTLGALSVLQTFKTNYLAPLENSIQCCSVEREYNARRLSGAIIRCIHGRAERLRRLVTEALDRDVASKALTREKREELEKTFDSEIRAAAFCLTSSVNFTLKLHGEKLEVHSARCKFFKEAVLRTRDIISGVYGPETEEMKQSTSALTHLLTSLLRAWEMYSGICPHCKLHYEMVYMLTLDAPKDKDITSQSGSQDLHLYMGAIVKNPISDTQETFLEKATSDQLTLRLKCPVSRCTCLPSAPRDLDALRMIVYSRPFRVNCTAVGGKITSFGTKIENVDAKHVTISVHASFSKYTSKAIINAYTVGGASLFSGERERIVFLNKRQPRRGNQ